MGLEGLGLAWCESYTDSGKWQIKEIDVSEMMSAVTRILAERRYTTIYYPFADLPGNPAFLRNYIKKSAEHIGYPADELIRAVEDQQESSESFRDCYVRVEISIFVFHKEIQSFDVPRADGSIFTKQEVFAQTLCVSEVWRKLIGKKTHLKNMVVIMLIRLIQIYSLTVSIVKS